ncbi:MFS transporter [Bacteroidota bacterium]
MLTYGLFGASGLFITSYWPLIISRTILGISISATFTSITVMILNLYDGRQRDDVIGWRVSSNNFAGVVWPIIGGFLGTFSWHMPFSAYLIGIPLGIIAFLTIPETPRGTFQTARTAGNRESVFSLLMKTPVLLVTYGLIFLTLFSLSAYIIFVPQIVQPFGIENPFYIGIIISTMGLAGTVTALVYGRIRAKMSYKAIVVMAMPVWIVGFATMSQASSVWLVILAMVLFGLGMGVIGPAVTVWTGESVPAQFRGRITSYLATFGFIGQFMSPIILSPIATSLGLNAVFIVLAGVSALVFIASLAFLRK